MAHQPSSASWQVCAESPHRAPVQYALGEMAQTVRARGGDFEVALWGPEDGAWQRYDVTPAATDTSPAPGPPAATEQPVSFKERMGGRRRQVLVAGLGKAGLHDLGPDDWSAVQALAEQLDETTVRRVAHWLAVAGGAR